ncbi:uncharacterized protein SPAPADRAFT_64276 [Spathaspora passalidarum NRRL Y-27907]|uniref:Uncharacterized protein n=1 Tax=Spathaspora passalidarum (strain NRRL Y-27907 / 11-Y1) TaxID=619300 RepID=G3AFU9_SPAPN|nr:uncharacterized protein SPAPADRAFT_64276 [Spathaspora passalidarum NRRL Y-27907]EGW35087.1 hypothetical protein SPAPADRAFT_64276 [Spathaspora passalidarum NRRL Y-27907]
MAASLREVKLHTTAKRKLNELEDISNIHTTPKQVKNHHHKKQRVTFNTNEKPLTRHSLRQQQQQELKQHKITASVIIPQQQRSPSPSEGSSPPAAPEITRSKSVSFDLSNNSPLLTPKDEEEEEEEEYNVSEDVYSDEGSSSSVPSTPATPPGSTTSIDDHPEVEEKHSFASERNHEPTIGLDTNADYIALTSCLRLATNNRNKITQEIVELSQLQQYHSQNENKEETIEFFLKLMNNDLNLPKPNKTIKCPIINWGKYHPALTNVSKKFENCDQFKKEDLDDSVYKSLNLFKNLK